MHTIELYKTSTGSWWLPSDVSSDIVINAMKNNEVFEPFIIDLAGQYITPGSTVLDVGSNFGQMAVLFSRMVGPSGKVHAFEADPFVFDLLQKNVEANGCTNVVLHAGAVWNKLGEELFYPEPDLKRFGSFGSYGIDLQASAGRKIPTITLDSVSFAPEEKISFIKVDIQGSDLFALLGAKNIIKKHKPTIVFEFEQQLQNEFGTSFEQYLKLTDDLDYEVVKVLKDINYVIQPITFGSKVLKILGMRESAVQKYSAKS